MAETRLSALQVGEREHAQKVLAAIEARKVARRIVAGDDVDGVGIGRPLGASHSGEYSGNPVNRLGPSWWGASITRGGY